MFRTGFVSAIMLVSLFICVDGLFGFTITVDGNGGGDYLTIQDGIDAASEEDTVLVAPCTYTGSGNRDIDFNGKGIVVMSSDGPDETIIDCQGLGRGFIFDSVEDLSSILDGFTIKNGVESTGGGIRVYFASPTITNCIIVNCSAGDGGGILVQSGSPHISHCTLEGNSADGGSGGGIRINSYSGFGSGPRVWNCTFTANSADWYGGGIHYYDVQPQFLPYSFLWGCRFIGNTAGYGGGGIYLRQSHVSIYNCLFDGNEVNVLYREGGGIYVYQSSEAVIHNCTLVYNYASSGGGIYSHYSTTTIFNNIVYWNIAGSGNSINYYPDSPTVTYSNIEGGWSGTGNMDADPQFAEEIDFHLEEDSPCVDTGDPAISDGSQPPGLGGTRSDMGTYGGSENGELLEGIFDLFLYPDGPTTVTAGDTVFFDALIWNSSDNPKSGNYWLTLVLPNQNEILLPPALLNHPNPVYGSTPAHDSKTISNELRTILTGTYRVIARIGSYPDLVFDEESFEIQVN